MRRNIKLTLTGAIVALAGFFIAVPILHASGGSCTDQTSVVLCGANSKTEIVSAYDKNARSMQTIYNYMGIDRGDLDGATLVQGTVYRNGDVYVGGKKVATGARTAGHNWGAGYGQVKIPNTTDAYSYTTGALVRDNRPVLVSMQNGEFQYAFMTECGNPIKATPVPAPKPQEVTPVYTCDSLTASATKITLGQPITLTTAATARDGATINTYVYTFGDGETATGGSTISHTYAKEGTYTATVVVKVDVDGKTVNAPGNNCKVTIEVAPEMCAVAGKETLPKNSPLCVEDKPAVEITKTVNDKTSDIVTVNNEFIYKIVVKNTGNISLKDAVVSDKAPAGVTFVSSADGTITDNAWTTTIAELKVGESKSFAITAKITEYHAGTIENTACVDTPTIPSTTADACDTATVTMPHMIDICDTATKTQMTIDEKNMKDTYTTDLTKCAAPVAPASTPVAPKTEMPAELPKTGMTDAIGGGIGLSALIGAVYYYRASRRLL